MKGRPKATQPSRPDVAIIVLKAIKDGASYTDAGKAAGMSPSSARQVHLRWGEWYEQHARG